MNRLSYLKQLYDRGLLSADAYVEISSLENAERLASQRAYERDKKRRQRANQVARAAESHINLSPGTAGDMPGTPGTAGPFNREEEEETRKTDGRTPSPPAAAPRGGASPLAVDWKAEPHRAHALALGYSEAGFLSEVKKFTRWARRPTKKTGAVPVLNDADEYFQDWLEKPEHIARAKAADAVAQPELPLAPPRKTHFDPKAELSAEHLENAAGFGYVGLACENLWTEFVSNQKRFPRPSADWMEDWNAWCRKQRLLDAKHAARTAKFAPKDGHERELCKGLGIDYDGINAGPGWGEIIDGESGDPAVFAYPGQLAEYAGAAHSGGSLGW